MNGRDQTSFEKIDGLPGGAFWPLVSIGHFQMFIGQITTFEHVFAPICQRDIWGNCNNYVWLIWVTIPK
jgi:hypothetical protein